MLKNKYLIISCSFLILFIIFQLLKINNIINYESQIIDNTECLSKEEIYVLSKEEKRKKSACAYRRLSRKVHIYNR